MELYLPKLNRFIEYKQTVHNYPESKEVKGATILLAYYDWIKWEGVWYQIKEGEIHKIMKMSKNAFMKFISKLPPHVN